MLSVEIYAIMLSVVMLNVIFARLKGIRRSGRQISDRQSALSLPVAVLLLKKTSDYENCSVAVFTTL